MSVVSVQPKSFILALFIRDDDERFLLGDDGYEFKDSQLHFSANSMENDEVAKQGADGVMLAGQVRRASVQSFDGYIGDATDAKDTIEEKRKAFIAFFAKGHHFRVVYVDCNRNAWQRKGGYIVDAPEVKELWQIHPEYHVGLNFEDVNYYSYDEDGEGQEILSNEQNVPISNDVNGGLEWDEDGAVSEDAEVEYDTETAVATPAKNVYITDATEAPLASFQLYGETSQNGTPTPDAPVPVQTVTGENVVKICGKNILNTDNTVGEQTQGGVTASMSGSVISIDGEGTGDDGSTSGMNRTWALTTQIPLAAGTYSISGTLLSGSWTAAAQSRLRSIRINLSSGTYKEVSASNGSTALAGNTFTLTEATNVVSVQIMVYGQVKFYDAEFGLQLELGSSASSFEPYQGQSYPIDLGGTIELDMSQATRLDAYINGSGVIVSSDANALFGIAVEPNTTYTITKIASSRFRYVCTSTTPAIGATVGTTTNNDSATSATVTTGASDTYLVCTYWSNTSTSTKDDVFNSVKITTGNSIELCKIGDYQDYIYKDGDTWKAYKTIAKKVFNGTETWAKSQYGTNNYQSPSVSPTPRQYPESLLNIVSNSFVGVSYTDRTVSTQNITYITSNSIWIRNTSFGTATEVAAYFTNNPTDFYFIRATATDTEITNEALITQLEALLNTARTYAGTNNIFTVTPNEQGTLEISYYTKYQPMVVSGGYVWEAGGSGGPTTVINDSISNVSPIWTVHGPILNPILENTTTGEEIEYVGMIAEGQTLVIDMGEQTALLNGLNVVSNVVGDYISLAPGRNTLLYSTSSGDAESEIGWSEIVG